MLPPARVRLRQPSPQKLPKNPSNFACASIRSSLPKELTNFREKGKRRSSIDGAQRLRLTKPSLVASSPHWSRDGKQILFTGLRPGYLRQIYFLSADGGALRAVLPEGREASDADWSPDGRYIAALDETNHRLLLYDFQMEKWNDVAEGGLLGAHYWTSNSSAIYLQDQLDSEQSIYRMKISNRQVVKVFSCGEILRSSPAHCIFSGLGLDGSLFVMVERGLTDIYALDLDLP
jgi:dipeptidyl aminopeptidase/acylaminoacyl peptidase